MAFAGPRILPETDVCVVGLGAAGAMASFALTRAGRKVVALEAGPPRTGREYAMDELQCSRIRNTWGATKFNAELPTWRPNARQPTQPLRPFQKVANGVGGSSNVYGAVSWRFHPDDFRIRSNTIARDGPSVPLIDGHRPKQLVRWTVMVSVYWSALKIPRHRGRMLSNLRRTMTNGKGTLRCVNSRGETQKGVGASMQPPSSDHVDLQHAIMAIQTMAQALGHLVERRHREIFWHRERWLKQHPELTAQDAFWEIDTLDEWHTALARIRSWDWEERGAGGPTASEG